MPYNYTCQHCGIGFQNKNKGKKYCSQKCAKEDSKRGTQGICTNCQKECYVAAYKINIRNNKKTFCCFECNMEWQRKRRPIRICHHCGKEFCKKARPKAMFCSIECKLNSDYNIVQLAFMRKKQAGKKINKLEELGYTLLSDLGIVFEPQWIYGKRYVADAYLPDYNAIVQFDGDYWHGNPRKFLILTDFQKSVQATDERANMMAKKEGLKVLRIWESDVKDAKQTILEFVKEIKKCPGA
jgi:very-short-patch-repair endonuclease